MCNLKNFNVHCTGSLPVLCKRYCGIHNVPLLFDCFVVVVVLSDCLFVLLCCEILSIYSSFLSNFTNSFCSITMFFSFSRQKRSYCVDVQSNQLKFKLNNYSTTSDTWIFPLPVKKHKIMVILCAAIKKEIMT